MLVLLLAHALAADGAPLAGIALGDLARNVPACQATPTAQAQLDLEKGCVVGQACVGMPLARIEAALGPADCGDSAPHGTRYCDFDQAGLRVGVDRDAPGVAHVIFLKDSDARTADGLGLGSSVACFLDRYQDSTVNVKVDYEDGWLLWRSIHFRDPRLIVTIDRDGRATQLQLTAPSVRPPVRRERTDRGSDAD